MCITVSAVPHGGLSSRVSAASLNQDQKHYTLWFNPDTCSLGSSPKTGDGNYYTVPIIRITGMYIRNSRQTSESTSLLKQMSLLLLTRLLSMAACTHTRTHTGSQAWQLSTFRHAGMTNL